MEQNASDVRLSGPCHCKVLRVTLPGPFEDMILVINPETLERVGILMLFWKLRRLKTEAEDGRTRYLPG